MKTIDNIKKRLTEIQSELEFYAQYYARYDSLDGHNKQVYDMLWTQWSVLIDCLGDDEEDLAIKLENWSENVLDKFESEEGYHAA